MLGNKITSLDPIKYLNKLQHLDFGFNKIQNIKSIVYLQELKELSISSTKITNITQLKYNYNLIKFNCYRCNIKSLVGLENMIQLKKLECYGTNIITLNQLKNCKSLEELQCSNTNIKTLKGLENCLNLKKIYCRNVILKSLEGLKYCLEIDKIEYGNSRNHINTIDPYISTVLDLLNYSTLHNNTEFRYIYNFNKAYVKMTIEQMNIFYTYLKNHVDILIEYNYINFINSNYFNDNKKEIVNKYKLVEFYDITHQQEYNTIDKCSICYDDTFNKFVKCKNNHVICYECYQLIIIKKGCCVCRKPYNIEHMFYIKPH